MATIYIFYVHIRDKWSEQIMHDIPQFSKRFLHSKHKLSHGWYWSRDLEALQDRYRLEEEASGLYRSSNPAPCGRNHAHSPGKEPWTDTYIWLTNMLESVVADSQSLKQCCTIPPLPTNANNHASLTLRWRHNGCDSVSNHQPHDCLINRLFRRRSKKTSKLRVTGLCVGNSPGTGEFPAQMASNAENISIWWRHHEIHIFSRILDENITSFQLKSLILKSNKTPF